MDELREHPTGDLRDDSRRGPRRATGVSSVPPPAPVVPPSSPEPDVWSALRSASAVPGGEEAGGLAASGSEQKGTAVHIGDGGCSGERLDGPAPGEPEREAGLSRFASDGEGFLRFVGRGSHLLWLYVVNFWFMALTLGVYSFWGKTRIRRYLWSRALMFGDPLEYTGTGWQLCRSFLIVVSLFFGFNLLLTLLSLISLEASLAASMVIVLGLALFWPYAVYSALRFRLARTNWRGIHGWLAGSPGEYAVQAWVRAMLTVVTLGLFAPHATAFLTRFIVDNASFGTEKFRFEADVKGLSRPYYFCWLAGLFILIGAGAATGLLVAERPLMRQEPDLVVFLPLALGLVGLLACRLVYSVALLNWRIRGVRFAGTWLESRVTVCGYCGLVLSNALFFLVTLGVAWPWTVVRRYHYLADRVFIRGEVRWADIRQNNVMLPKSGEGLLSFLDLDLGF